MCFKVFVAELCNVLHARCVSSVVHVAGLLRSRRNLERLRSAPRSACHLWRQHVSWMGSEAAADQTRPPASRRRCAPSPVIPKRARCAISDLDRKLGAKLRK